MIVGHHLIWAAYGCWLPNDPRGSCSRDLRQEKLGPLGEIHYERKRVQPSSRELRAFYRQAEPILEHERLTFDEVDVAVLAASFGATIRQRGYTCYACAIMWDHLHLLIRRHRDFAEVMTEQMQQASRQALVDGGRRPRDHPVWGGPGWKRFLNTRQDMVEVADYIRRNPLEVRQPEQRWAFVQEYDGWLPAPAKK